MDRRVEIDFEVTFANGGGLRGEGFRVDIDGEEAGDEVVADALVRDLRLLMVGKGMGTFPVRAYAVIP